jgi:RPA family protein
MNSKGFGRETAVKLPLNELINAEFFPGIKEFEANHLITKNNFRIARINLWGIIQKKEINQLGLMLELNDLTGKFNALIPDELNLNESFNEGESIQAIGKIRSGNPNYVLIELIKKISFKEELLKRIDNIYSLKNLKKHEKNKEEGIKIERRQI